MRAKYSITGEAYQEIGLLKVDKIVIGIPSTEKIWESHDRQIFEEIKKLPKGEVKNGEGYCTTDRSFKRRREFSNEDHLIEIFYKSQPVKGKEGIFPNPYKAYLRITNKNFFKGDEEHVEIAIQIESIFNKYGIRHFLGTGKECCELAVDFPTYEMWRFVEDRLLWRWTGPKDHTYYDEEKKKVVPGFDPLKDQGAESHYVKRPDEQRKVRRFFHGYIESDIGKHRQEMRLNRDFLKAHGIETVRDLLENGKALVERHFSLWEPDIGKILRQRRKYEKERECAELYRRTENYYRKLVQECSAAEVLKDLCMKLKHLSPYEIKEKCFKSIPGPKIEQTAFKRERRIDRIEIEQDNLSIENEEGKMRYNTPIFMHESSPKNVKKESSAHSAIRASN